MRFKFHLVRSIDSHIITVPDMTLELRVVSTAGGFVPKSCFTIQCPYRQGLIIQAVVNAFNHNFTCSIGASEK